MNRRYRQVLFLFLVEIIVGGMAHGQDSDYLKDLKAYIGSEPVDGTIRIWGNSYIPALVQQWEDGFRRHHPSIKFETTLKGTETAVAGVYGGIADLGFVGREIYASELDAFKERFGYDPLIIEISSGSYNTPHKTFSLEVFVHKSNPVTQLTVAELDAIFGCELRAGAKQRIHRWGDLGLTGHWADRPIHVYGYEFRTGMAEYFRRVVLKGSFLWNAELKDFDNGHAPDGQIINAGTYVLQALANDPYGIAYANVLYSNAHVKTIALAQQFGGPSIEPTKANVWRRLYPITRYTTVVANRKPGTAVDPKIKEFLRYILSKDGMEAVVRDGSYLPLTEELIEQQLGKLQ